MRKFFIVVNAIHSNDLFGSLEEAKREAEKRAKERMEESKDGGTFFVMEAIGSATYAPAARWDETNGKGRKVVAEEEAEQEDIKAGINVTINCGRCVLLPPKRKHCCFYTPRESAMVAKIKKEIERNMVLYNDQYNDPKLTDYVRTRAGAQRDGLGIILGYIKIEIENQQRKETS